MNGIHDLGGMHGFGRINVEANEPAFHEAWEGRVFAMAALTASLGLRSLDSFRHAIERLSPVAYLTAGYYGRWLAALETLLAEAGVVTREELDSRVSGRLQPETGPASLAGSSTPLQAPRGAQRSIDAAPRFSVGQAVRTRNMHPSGHTRLPRYARGKRGVVARVHPVWVFPDSNAHGRGEQPQYAYAVRFEAAELWGPDAEARAAVHVDCFEMYLEPDAAHE
jgi:nitrile hydratase beta subunit